VSASVLAACVLATGCASSSRPGGNLQMEVLYAGHGIELVATGLGTGVGVASDVDTNAEQQPRLYLSQDLVRWRNITPPGALKGDGNKGDVNVITGASWISSTVGWVSTCRDLSFGQAIFQTTDGGKAWRSIPDPGVDGQPFDCYRSVELLKANVGVYNDGGQLEGGSPLEVTDDDGQTWIAPYSLFGGDNADPDRGVVFADRNDAVALGGPPRSQGPGMQVSHDGGRTWTAVMPPAPAGGDAVYSLPAFPGGGVDLISAVAVTATGAGTVQLDSSTDGGSTWSIVARFPFATTGRTDASVSVVAGGAWWVSLPTAIPTIEVSRDQGRTWLAVEAQALSAAPVLTAVDDTSALATETIPSPFFNAVVVETNDGGRHWTRLQLPSK